MTWNDQPNLPPVDLNDLENAGGEPETDTDDESSGSESGFEFNSSEDEISEDIFQHYVREQDHDDLVQENEDLQRQQAAMIADGEAIEKEKDELKQAIKRKLQEREEWTRIKRLRVSIQEAYEAMGIAVPLVEGGVATGPPGDEGATGGDRASAEEVVAAMNNFEEAAAEARRCLDDLTLYQSQMDEN